RLDDGVGRHLQLQRQRPDRRQFFAGQQQAGRDQVFHLVDDLPVDRHAVGQVDGDVHGVSADPAVQVYEYTDTIIGVRQASRRLTTLSRVADRTLPRS